MYCKFCGQQIHDDAVICVHCGRSLANKSIVSEDTGNIGWGVLGFFVPIAGFILYLLWNKERPKDARIAGKGALIAVILGAVAFVLYFIFIMILLLSVAAV